MESTKSTSDLIMPVTGTVVEINDALEDHPEWINQEPYDSGWMIKCRPHDMAQLRDLVGSYEYRDFVIPETQGE